MLKYELPPRHEVPRIQTRSTTKFSWLLVLILVVLSVLALPVLAEAARLYFEPDQGTFSSETVLPVYLRIDTEKERINTIEAYIRFSEDIFDVERLSDGNSIISLWVERPSANANNVNGQIMFSGIIPGGYEEKDGLVLKIFLKSKKEGSGWIGVEPNSRVLLHDGQGTPSDLTVSQAVFDIQAAGLSFLIPQDNDLPEPFTPHIARDSTIFDGEWFLVYATQDKGSGIDHYEIHETTRIQILKDTKEILPRKDAKWVVAESPYSLRDQKLQSYIFVKAVDMVGNERIAVLPPQKPLIWYKNYTIWTIIILGVLLAYAIWRILWRRYKKSQ